jgi:hypothetical protein
MKHGYRVVQSVARVLGGTLFRLIIWRHEFVYLFLWFILTEFGLITSNDGTIYKLWIRKYVVEKSAGLVSGIIFVFASTDRREPIKGKDMNPGPSEIERVDRDFRYRD